MTLSMHEGHFYCCIIYVTYSSMVVCLSLVIVVCQLSGTWVTFPQLAELACFLSINFCIVSSLIDPFRCACSSYRMMIRKPLCVSVQNCSVLNELLGNIQLKVLTAKMLSTRFIQFAALLTIPIGLS